MRAVAVVVLAGCSTPAPRDAARSPAPPPTVAHYRVDDLAITGAPPLDRALAGRRPPEPVAARVLDLTAAGTLIARGGRCENLIEREAPQPIPRCVPGWARHTAEPRTPVFEVAYADERAELQLGGRAISPRDTLVEPLWDALRARAFYGHATDRPAELWMSTADGSSTRIAGEGPWAPLDVSPDGRFVLARREPASARAGLYRIEVATGAAIALTDPDELALRAVFAGGDVLAIVERDEHRVLVAISTRWRRELALPGDVVDVALAAPGIVAVVERDGWSAVRLVDPVTGDHRPIRDAPEGGVIRDLRAHGSRVAVTYGDPSHPPEVHVVNLGGATGTRVPAGAIATSTPARHAVTAADGVSFELLAYPPIARTRAPAPVIVEFHGGPEDRWLPRYDRWVDFATAEGYAVIRPNVRGSAGQGRTFAARDDGERRGDVIRDVAATLDWIAAQPELDASRVVVMGTSYGGYLALAALHTFPERLRGGITLSAVTDFVGLLEGTAAYRRDHRRAEYGDEREPATRARLARLAPRAWAGELRRPLLMAYGQRDPRVPPATTEAFLVAVRAAGVPVWSIAAADEGHWFERPGARAAFEVLALQFAAAAVR